MKGRRGRCFLGVMLGLLACALLSSGKAGEAFSFTKARKFISYGENYFTVNAPEEGELTITVTDETTTYRTLRQEISAGKTRIAWDGCAENREPLYQKSYDFTAELRGVSGENYRHTFPSEIEYVNQALLLGLPSGPEITLDQPGEWFVEAKSVLSGTLLISFSGEDSDTPVLQYKKKIARNRIEHFTYEQLASGGRTLSPGTYRLTLCEASNPAVSFTYDIRVTERAPDALPLEVTAEFLPTPGMTDGEIWELMMAPSVVIDLDFYSHQEVKAEPEEKSETLGTLHGQTQAVRLMEIGEEWSRIGAWNHEEAEYIEGWVPTGRLKTVSPGTEYGLLLDKKAQTLTVFRQGKRLGTVQVSTGVMEKNNLDQETAAGSFLTGYHRVNFSTNGLRYDYVIQYDGGNMLHQIPYAWGKGKKDFTPGKRLLGSKASHACIRIQEQAGEGGINAFWLWQRLPFRTRLMILDDPEERAAEKAAIDRSDGE